MRRELALRLNRVLCAALLISLVFGCQHSTSPSAVVFRKTTGTILLKPTMGFYFIKADRPVKNVEEFYPENLPDEYKRDSLRIRFSGIVTTPPDLPAPYMSVKSYFVEIHSADPQALFLRIL